MTWPNGETQEWHRLGEEARLAHAAVDAAFRAGVRTADPARYEALLRDFHVRTAAALPSSRPGFLQALAAGNGCAIDSAVAFLEADPWFFRSGYEKQALIRHLKRASLSTHQRERLAHVVLAAIDGRDRVEFRHFCRLACSIWSDLLDEEVAKRMQSTDVGIRRRATWVAEATCFSGKA